MSKITFGTNLSSLFAQRKVADADAQLSRTYERLSSGQRINRASDDPAGLAVALGGEVQSKIYRQAVRNVNDGISLTSVVHGALNELSHITTKQHELAEQAANGNYSRQQREALDQEAYALSQEYNRIVASTAFNGVQLLSAGGSTLQLMAGTGNSGLLSVAVAQQLDRTVGSGEFDRVTISSFVVGSTEKVDAADINKDGITDAIVRDAANQYQIYFGQANGSYTASGTIYNNMLLTPPKLGDFNGDGNVDLVAFSSATTISVFLGNGTSIATTAATSISSAHTNLQVADLNGDGKVEILSNDTGAVDTYALNASNQIGRISSIASTLPQGYQIGDFNGDGNSDIVAFTTGTVRLHYGNSSGGFGSANQLAISQATHDVADYNHDGYADLFVEDGGTFKVYTNLKEGSLTAISSPINCLYGQITSADFDNDGDVDLLELAGGAGNKLLIYENNGNGAFTAAPSQPYNFSGPVTVRLASINGDQAPDLIVADANGTYAFLQRTTGDYGTKRYNLLSASAARTAIDEINQQQERISSELGSVGAAQSRLELAVSALAKMSDEFSASTSRIMNADMAEESAAMVRIQILQQSAISASLKPKH